MKKLDLANGRDVPAPLPPIGSTRDEIIGRGQLDIEVELILQNSNRFERPLWLRVQLDIDTNGPLAKTQQQRRGATGKVNLPRASRRCREAMHKLLERGQARFSPHASEYIFSVQRFK